MGGSVRSLWRAPKRVWNSYQWILIVWLEFPQAYDSNFLRDWIRISNVEQGMSNVEGSMNHDFRPHFDFRFHCSHSENQAIDSVFWELAKARPQPPDQTQPTK